MKTVLVLTAVITAAAASTAAASFINNATGITDPVRTITFDEHVLPRATQVTDQYADLGVRLRPYLWYDVIINDLPNVNGHRVGNSAVGDLQDPFRILFTEPRTSAAFGAQSNRSDLFFTALLNGVVVELGSARHDGVTDETSFYGFSGIVFDEILVHQQVLSGTAGVLVDNIQLGPAFPAPGAAPLLGIATAALFRRRR